MSNTSPEAYETLIHDMQRIESLSARELDGIPFGTIRLDRDGNVLSFNLAEAKLTGRDPKAVIGKNFFREIAPCTNVAEFYGRFKQGVAERKLHAVFPYRFDYKMNPRDVSVTLFYSDKTDSIWVFVRERAAK